MCAEKSNFPVDLPFSEKDIRSVLSTPAGRKLFQLLTQSGGGELSRAVEQWKQGNPDGAREILAPLMNTPQAASLVDEINRSCHGGD